MNGNKIFNCPKNAQWTATQSMQPVDMHLTFSDYERLTYICVEGEDTLTFLQGQLTCDIKQVKHNKPHLAALCTFQGRVIAVMFIHRHQDQYWLQLPTDLSEKVFSYLQKYAQFSKVNLCIDTVETACNDNWRLQLIKAGIPFIFKETSEKFTPHMLNLHKMKAIDFDKGCYVGQEVIARTHYKGKPKRALFYSTFDDTLELAPGMDVIIDDTHVGTIIDAAVDEGKTLVLAVLTLDALTGTK